MQEVHHLQVRILFCNGCLLELLLCEKTTSNTIDFDMQGRGLDLVRDARGKLSP